MTTIVATITVMISTITTAKTVSELSDPVLLVGCSVFALVGVVDRVAVDVEVCDRVTVVEGTLAVDCGCVSALACELVVEEELLVVGSSWLVDTLELLPIEVD